MIALMENAAFYPFKPFSAKEWKAKINQDLKVKTFTDLLWQQHGLEGKPFYMEDDLPKTLPQVAHANAFGHRSWVNYHRIEVSDEKRANLKALEVLQQGADGLIFHCSQLPQLPVLLKDILLPYCAVGFEWSDENDLIAFQEQFLDYLREQQYNLKSLSGFMGGKYFLKDMPLRSYVLRVENKYAAPLALAIALAKWVDDFDAIEGVSPKEYFRQLQIQLTLSDDYFFEIARLRAIRAIVCQLAQAYDLNLSPGEVRLFCEIGPWNTAVEDVNHHMMQATSRAMSAVLGGADALHVHPFYSVFPEKPLMAERLARNISGIIKEESHLDKVLDPAEGSYYVEHLTYQLMKKSLLLLQEIEEKGGLSAIDKAAFIEKNSKP